MNKLKQTFDRIYSLARQTTYTLHSPSSPETAREWNEYPASRGGQLPLPWHLHYESKHTNTQNERFLINIDQTKQCANFRHTLPFNKATNEKEKTLSWMSLLETAVEKLPPSQSLESYEGVSSVTLQSIPVFVCFFVFCFASGAFFQFLSFFLLCTPLP